MRVSESQQRGALHYHALFRFIDDTVVSRPNPFDWMKVWESIGRGHARISPYNYSDNAAYYILKGIGKDAELDFDERWDIPLSGPGSPDTPSILQSRKRALTSRTKAGRMSQRHGMDPSRRGDVVIASGSVRPPSLGDVMTRVICPALLEAVLRSGDVKT